MYHTDERLFIVFHLNIIPVGSETLSARWSKIDIGTNHRAKVVLKKHSYAASGKAGGL